MPWFAGAVIGGHPCEGGRLISPQMLGSSPTGTSITAGPPAVAEPRTEGEIMLCYVCGDIMQRAGSCHACPSCGATSGCS